VKLSPPSGDAPVIIFNRASLPCSTMRGTETKAGASLSSDALPLYHHLKTTGIKRSSRKRGGSSCVAI